MNNALLSSRHDIMPPPRIARRAQVQAAVDELDNLGLDELAWLLDGNACEIPKHLLNCLNGAVGPEQ